MRKTSTISTDDDEYNDSDVKVNHSYLIKFAMVFNFASAIQLGWTISETGQMGYILDQKLDWKATEDTDG